MTSHTVPVDVFVLLLEGQMDISSGDETSRFVAGEYIVFPANMTYTLICAETARLLIYRLLTAKIITELPDTLSQVINRLRVQGYIEDLNRHDNNLWLDPDAYGVNEVFRFKTVRRSRAN